MNKCYSQNNIDSQLLIFELPVKSGYINIKKNDELLGTYSDPTNSVNIFSQNDNVFNIEPGVIVKILKRENSFTLFVKGDRGVFFTYDNLFDIKYAVGEKIGLGDLLGKLNAADTCNLKGSTTNLFELRFRITTYQREYTYEELLNYFVNRSKK